jgi:hypothetical protein
LVGIHIEEIIHPLLGGTGPRIDVVVITTGEHAYLILAVGGGRPLPIAPETHIESKGRAKPIRNHQRAEEIINIWERCPMITSARNERDHV